MKDVGVVSIWRIATDTPTYTADDFRGEGARITGGRWNRPGSPVVYASQSIALACLETVIHLELGGLPLNRYLVRIDIPTAMWKRRAIFQEALHVGWDALPAGKVSMDFGNNWIAGGKTALLQVPSVIIPEEANILINPAHKDTHQFTVNKLRKWQFDGRLQAR